MRASPVRAGGQPFTARNVPEKRSISEILLICFKVQLGSLPRKYSDLVRTFLKRQNNPCLNTDGMEPLCPEVLSPRTGGNDENSDDCQVRRDTRGRSVGRQRERRRSRADAA